MDIEQGRVALVTGSTSGLGREMALRLASAGARVVVTGRDEGRGDEVVGGSFVSGLHLAGYICAGAFLVGAVLSFSYLNASGKASSEQA